MDKGYVDFKRLYTIHQASVYWITRAKGNFSYTRQYSKTVDKVVGIICDQIGVLKRESAYQNYQEKIRRIKYYDSISQVTYIFITNNMLLSTSMVAALYKQRWQIQLFFKWIKQHLKIKSFFGTSRNAVYTQNMDCGKCSCINCNHKEKFKIKTFTLHFITKINRLCYLENTHTTSV